MCTYAAISSGCIICVLYLSREFLLSHVSVFEERIAVPTFIVPESLGAIAVNFITQLRQFLFYLSDLCCYPRHALMALQQHLVSIVQRMLIGIIFTEFTILQNRYKEECAPVVLVVVTDKLTICVRTCPNVYVSLQKCVDSNSLLRMTFMHLSLPHFVDSSQIGLPVPDFLYFAEG